MLHNDIHGIEFGNPKLSLYTTHLYCGLPSKIYFLYLPYALSLSSYYIYQYDHGLFLCIRNFHQTFAMLVQQLYQKTQPFYTSHHNGEGNIANSTIVVNTNGNNTVACRGKQAP